MIIPTIHLNGTSKEELARQLEDAHSAITFAQTKLRQAAPNAPDYYPQGPDAIYQATDDHMPVPGASARRFRLKRRPWLESSGRFGSAKAARIRQG